MRTIDILEQLDNDLAFDETAVITCGCNVFHHPDMGTKEETLRTYDCNACDTRYIGE